MQFLFCKGHIVIHSLAYSELAPLPCSLQQIIEGVTMSALRRAVENVIFDLAKKKSQLEYVTTAEVMMRLAEQGTVTTRTVVTKEMKLVADKHGWTVWNGMSGPLIDVKSILG